MQAIVSLVCCLCLLMFPAWPGQALAAQRGPYPLPPASEVTLPILMYHHLRDLAPNASATWRSVTVNPRDFADQMAYLAQHGYHSISFADLLVHFDEGRALPENPVIITFDDAWQEQYDVAYPILHRQGMVATFFVPADWPDMVQGSLTWAEMQEMSAAGMEFGSHTKTHPYLTRLKPEGLRQELEDSRTTLEEHVGKPVVVLAYPYGLYNAGVIMAAEKAGYRLGVTIVAGTQQSVYSRYQLRRTGIAYGTSLHLFSRLLGVVDTPPSPEG